MTVIEQWIWRMDWCNGRGLAPANSAIWELSGKELAKHIGCVLQGIFKKTELCIQKQCLILAVLLKQLGSVNKRGAI